MTHFHHGHLLSHSRKTAKPSLVTAIASQLATILSHQRAISSSLAPSIHWITTALNRKPPTTNHLRPKTCQMNAPLRLPSFRRAKP